jgi:hypothetical protein
MLILRKLKVESKLLVCISIGCLLTAFFLGHHAKHESLLLILIPGSVAGLLGLPTSLQGDHGDGSKETLSTSVPHVERAARFPHSLQRVRGTDTKVRPDLIDQCKALMNHRAELIANPNVIF